MDEYIKKETAIRALLNDSPEQVGYSREDAADCIRYMNAADVAPVRHGKWLDGRCTVCGWEEPDVCTWIGYDSEAWIETSYCPNCGSLMLEG